MDYIFFTPSACVRMLDWFDHHGHVCIAFELLGLSTYDFLKENNFQPFSIYHIRHMAYQIIRAVRCESWISMIVLLLNEQITQCLVYNLKLMLISFLFQFFTRINWRTRTWNQRTSSLSIQSITSSTILKWWGELLAWFKVSESRVTVFKYWCGFDLQRRDERTLKNPDVKVVDFGNATYEHEHHTSVVSTRHYRAPEVILGKQL